MSINVKFNQRETDSCERKCYQLERVFNYIFVDASCVRIWPQDMIKTHLRQS